MNTIRLVGGGEEIPMAGSVDKPTTTRITACPACYGKVPWKSDSITKSACEVCGLELEWIDRRGFAYELSQLSWRSPLRSLGWLIWTVAQIIDHYGRLRKNLLYAIFKIWSRLP